ncbi:MAG: 4'-phosphopantetheinyl transferase superfamily protein, partial [Clostridiales bacterium]|nr:4'-phosphopantetheinyl transferase superfamily protein [Clostridiales bacterium]
MQTVQLYYMNISELSVSPHTCISQLRAERINAISSEQLQKQSLGVELLLNYYARTNSKSVPVEYAYNNLGKPCIIDESFYFSLAHSGNIAMCAVSDCDVGLDVETKKEVKLALSKKVFSDFELQNFNLAENKADFLIKTWTAKEAYLKLTGQGLRYPMNNVSVDGSLIFDTENKPLAFITIQKLSNNSNFAVATYKDHKIELKPVTIE